MNAEIMSSASFDPREFRHALGCYVTGIAVITARADDGTLAGVTVNSFASVSLAPPLVLWSLSLYSPSLAVFQHARHYAINVLAADQIEYSQRFSRPADATGSKFTGLEFDTGLGGSPLLRDACAWFECRNETRHPGGDHLIFIGQVDAFRRSERAPLLYHAGQSRTLQPCNPERISS